MSFISYNFFEFISFLCRKKSVSKFVFVAIAAILICFCVYTLTGVFGFLTFGVDVDPDVIKSYDAHNTFVIIARFGEHII